MKLSGSKDSETYRIVYTIGRGVSDRKLVDQNPLLERLDVVDIGHAGTCLVKVVGDIIDDRPPVYQIARGLVSKLLTVQRIALVRVVSNELTFVLPEKTGVSTVISISAYAASLQEFRLPDGVGSVSGVRSATLSNMADKLPRPRSVCTDVQVDTSTIVAPAVSRTKDGTCRVACHRSVKFRQGRLCTEAPSVDLVSQVRDVFPVGTSVLALEDWEVIRVVSGQRGGSDDSTILQLRVARVGDALVTSGLVDGVIGEVSPWSGLVAPAVRLCNGDLRKKRGSSE